MNVIQQLRSLKQRLPHFISRRLRWIGVAIAVFVSIVFYGIVVLSQQPVTISVLMPAPDTPPWRPLIEEFQSQNPNIRVNIIEGPNASNAVEDLYTSSFLLGDSPYDMVYMDVIWVPKFAAAGWLQDLSDRVNQQDLSNFTEASIAASRYEDGLYQLPIRADVGMLYYRTDLLQQIGAQPPQTFTELIDISQRLQEQADIPWGYVWQGRQYEGLSAMFVEVLEGAGGFWVNPETLEVGLDRPEALRAIEFLRNTIDQGVSPQGVSTYQEEEVRRFFQSGQTVFMRNWPYAVALGREEGSEIAGNFDIKPMVHAQGQESAACLGGWGLGIASTTSHPDEVWQFIEFFTSEETQRKFLAETGYVPSRTSLFNDPQLVSQYNYFPDLLEIVRQAVIRPNVAQYAQASDILQRYLSAAITDRMSPEDAMRRAAEETRTLFGSLTRG
jgi:multiple sugar transport system substrate-binding protein